MCYTTEQSLMSLAEITIFVKRIMRLVTQNNLVKILKNETASKIVINFSLMLSRRRF